MPWRSVQPDGGVILRVLGFHCRESPLAGVVDQPGVKSQQAVRQALDLQGMHGKDGTVPVLFVETCGIALASSVLLREETGLNAHGNGMVLLVSKRAQELQLIWGV